MKKRTLSMLLVLAMVFSMIPVFASAAEAATPEITSVSMRLNGILDVNFKVAPNGADMSKCSVAVSGAVNQTVSQPVQEGELYVYTVKVPAHKLPEALTVKLVYDGTEVQTKEWSAISDYLSKLSGSEALTDLAAALNGYGTYAAAYAAGKATDPIDGVTAEDLVSYKSVVAVNTPGLGASASLYIDDAVDLRVKFKESAWQDGYQLLIDGVDKTAELSAENGQKVYRVQELLPQDWSHMYDIKIVNGEATVFQCSYGVNSYVYAALSKAEEAAVGLNNLLKSMYWYGDAAQEYTAKVSGDSWTIIGEVGGTSWNADLPMTRLADGTWKSDVAYTMTANTAFKCRNHYDWNDSVGSGNIKSDGSLEDYFVAQSGTYYICLDPATRTITLIEVEVPPTYTSANIAVTENEDGTVNLTASNGVVSGLKYYLTTESSDYFVMEATFQYTDWFFDGGFALSDGTNTLYLGLIAADGNIAIGVNDTRYAAWLESCDPKVNTYWVTNNGGLADQNALIKARLVYNKGYAQLYIWNGSTNAWDAWSDIFAVNGWGVGLTGGHTGLDISKPIYAGIAFAGSDPNDGGRSGQGNVLNFSVDFTKPENTDVWAAIGDLNGTGWGTDFYMIKQADGTWITEQSFALTAGQQLKCRNHPLTLGWADQVGGEGTQENGEANNYVVAADGTYYIQLDPTTRTITLITVSKDSWTIIGEVGGTSWDTDLPMTLQADGTWKSDVAYTMKANTAFKCRNHYDWNDSVGSGNIKPDGSLEDYFVAQSGTYYICLDPATRTITLIEVQVGTDNWDFYEEVKAETRNNIYAEDGNDGVTTLFVGDSFFDTTQGFWQTYGADLYGKDAIVAGIGGSTTEDWYNYLMRDIFLNDIAPKNLVVNIGNNDIYNDGLTGAQYLANTSAFFEAVHEEMPNTNIYVFSITPRTGDYTSAEAEARLADANAALKNWCSGEDWITFIDISSEYIELKDDIHPKDPYYASVFLSALSEAGCVMEAGAINDSWTVIGEVGGTSWDTDLPMTLQEDGTWKSDHAYTMEAGTAFKCRNHSDWGDSVGNGEYKADGSLQDYFVAQSGTYYICLDPATRTITLIAENVPVALGTIAIRDPYILNENGTYYLYGTQDFGTVKVYESTDLSMWTLVGNCFEGGDDFWGNLSAAESGAEGGYWAPEVHAYNGAYYMLITFTQSGTKNQQATAILKADSPVGPFEPWSDGPITPAGHSCLDATLYVENGTPYLIFAHEWQCTCKSDGTGSMAYVKLSSDLKSTDGSYTEWFSAAEFTDISWWDQMFGAKNSTTTDGPFVYTDAQGQNYLLWSTHVDDDTYVEIATRFSTLSAAINVKNNSIDLYNDNGGHGMIFTDNEGQDIMVLHAPNSGATAHAQLFNVTANNGNLSIGQVQLEATPLGDSGLGQTVLVNSQLIGSSLENWNTSNISNGVVTTSKNLGGTFKSLYFAEAAADFAVEAVFEYDMYQQHDQGDLFAGFSFNDGIQAEGYALGNWDGFVTTGWNNGPYKMMVNYPFLKTDAAAPIKLAIAKVGDQVTFFIDDVKVGTANWSDISGNIPATNEVAVGLMMNADNAATLNVSRYKMYKGTAAAQSYITETTATGEANAEIFAANQLTVNGHTITTSRGNWDLTHMDEGYVTGSWETNSHWHTLYFADTAVDFAVEGIFEYDMSKPHDTYDLYGGFTFETGEGSGWALGDWDGFVTTDWSNGPFKGLVAPFMKTDTPREVKLAVVKQGDVLTFVIDNMVVATASWSEVIKTDPDLEHAIGLNMHSGANATLKVSDYKLYTGSSAVTRYLRNVNSTETADFAGDTLTVNGTEIGNARKNWSLTYMDDGKVSAHQFNGTSWSSLYFAETASDFAVEGFFEYDMSKEHNQYDLFGGFSFHDGSKQGYALGNWDGFITTDWNNGPFKGLVDPFMKTDTPRAVKLAIVKVGDTLTFVIDDVIVATASWNEIIKTDSSKIQGIALYMAADNAASLNVTEYALYAGTSAAQDYLADLA